MVLPAFITKGFQFIAESVGSDVLPKLTSKSFGSILGPDEENPQLVTDLDLRAELQEIISGLGNLYDGLKEMGLEIEGFQLAAKTERLQAWVDSINTLSDEYWTTVQQLAKCATGGSDESNMKKLKQARKRLCELGERIKAELYGHTVNIDSVISGSKGESFFALVNKQNLENCDFYSYFCRMRSELFYYWTVQFKATVLMQMVAQDPAVGFVNGQALADLVSQRLDAQEKYANTLMPETAFKLAMAFAKDESGKLSLPITLRTHKGMHIHSGSTSSDTVCYIDFTPGPCKIEPVQSVAVPQLNRDYYFYFRSDSARMVVNINGSAILPTFGPPAAQYFDVWKIQVTAEGEFRLKPLNLKEPFFSNIKKFMAVSWVGGSGTTLGDLDPTNPDQLLTIELK